MFFKQAILGFKNNLTKIGSKEPLNFFSIVLILGLDLFVLVNIFQGLDAQTAQLTAPWEKIPYECENLLEVNSPQEQKTLVAEMLSKYENYYQNNEYKYREEFINEANQAKIDPLCRMVFDAANTVRANAKLQEQHSQVQKIQSESDQFQNQIEKYTTDYDTMLQEQQAGQLPENSILTGNTTDVKIRIEDLNNQINTNKLRIENIEKSIFESNDVQSFISIAKQNKQLILDQKKSLEFWHSLKVTGVEFVFLLPLLFFFIYLYRRSLSKNNELMIFIMSHLLVVVSIPVVFEVIHLLMEVLPLHILADFIALLKALNIAIIWNYLLILIGIGIVVVLIYIVQKKLFSRQRLGLKRIAQKRCQTCGVKLSTEAKFCYHCGENQLALCQFCQKPTYKSGLYCIHCGKPQS